MSDTQPGRNGGILKRGNNPKPKGAVSLTKALEKKLREGTTLDEIVSSTILLAKEGNGVALKLVWDRIDGPVTEKVDSDIRIKVEFGDDPVADPAPRAGESREGSEEV